MSWAVVNLLPGSGMFDVEHLHRAGVDATGVVVLSGTGGEHTVVAERQTDTHPVLVSPSSHSRTFSTIQPSLGSRP